MLVHRRLTKNLCQVYALWSLHVVFLQFLAICAQFVVKNMVVLSILPEAVLMLSFVSWSHCRITRLEKLLVAEHFFCLDLGVGRFVLS